MHPQRGTTGDAGHAPPTPRPVREHMTSASTLRHGHVRMNPPLRTVRSEDDGPAFARALALGGQCRQRRP
jgi:hypothetical protein